MLLMLVYAFFLPEMACSPGRIQELVISNYGMINKSVLGNAGLFSLPIFCKY